MPPGDPNPCSKLTRREALVLGAAAGVTATVGVAPDALASTSVGGTGSGSGPAYLRRSGYVERVGERFLVGGHALTLVSVADVAGARADADLRGHDAAFSLTLTGPADVIPSALYEVHNDMLGPFPLFLGPIEEVRGTTQTYEAVIDRTIRVRTTGPAPASLIKDAAPAPSAPAHGGPDGEPAPVPSARDLEIVAARERVVLVARATRRRRARHAHNRQRRAHLNRMTFVRRQRKAARNIRRRWLVRHGV
ncbi:MAG TPA: hypothetical protein VF587_10160 [Solirubrobacteraceae bacterium]